MGAAQAGANGDKPGETNAKNIVEDLKELLGDPNSKPEDFTEFWEKQKMNYDAQGNITEGTNVAKRERPKEIDLKLLEAVDPESDIIKLIGKTFTMKNSEYRTAWKIAGIEVARTFFHAQRARKKLANPAFVDSLLLVTLPEQTPDDDDDDDDDEEDKPKAAEERKKQQQELDNNSLLVVNTMLEMADWPQFRGVLLTTAVLNELCIMLNSVEKARDKVTHVLEKLSKNKESLVVFTEGAVGDVLESFFKTANYQRPEEADSAEDIERWKIDVMALSHCTNVVATLTQFQHPCQVELDVIMQVFNYQLGANATGASSGKPAPPDNVRLQAEMARLFYWKCRHSSDVVGVLREVSGGNDPAAVLDTLVKVWTQCLATQKLITDFYYNFNSATEATFKARFCSHDLEPNEKLDPGFLSKQGDSRDKTLLKEKMYYSQMRLCYLSCLLWVLLPRYELRWKLRDIGLKKLFRAFDLTQEEFLRVILDTVRFIADQPQAQECYQLIEFFGKQLLVVLQNYTRPGGSICAPPDETLNVSGASMAEDDDEEIDQDGNNNKGLSEKQLKEQLKAKRLQRANRRLLNLLLDALSVIALNRNMQVKLKDYNVWGELEKLKHETDGRIAIAILRTRAGVLITPAHRLTWLDTHDNEEYCTNVFRYLQDTMKNKFSQDSTKDNAQIEDQIKTLASLLLTLRDKNDRFKKAATVSDITPTFSSILDWWQANTTARYEDERQSAEDDERGAGAGAADEQKSLVQLLKTSRDREEDDERVGESPSKLLTSLETTNFCAPFECSIALSLFSRLALEPRFKKLFFEKKALKPLLACVYMGIWSEAREAAAAIANLMWLPDLNEERLLCWLKFDGPKCVTVDAANVLLPCCKGHPKQVDIGKGMYQAYWGIEFVKDSAVILHPDGLRTDEVPGLLTTASPMDQGFGGHAYHWLDIHRPDKKCFSITCWFYWQKSYTRDAYKVLLQSKPDAKCVKGVSRPIEYYKVWVKEGDWYLRVGSGDKKPRKVKVPELEPGWHFLAIVCSTLENPDFTKTSEKFNGTKLYIDTWGDKQEPLRDEHLSNDFYAVGNEVYYDDGSARRGNHLPVPTAGEAPIGLITDFRIYARSLKFEQIKQMHKASDKREDHPDKITRELANLDAVSILATRLDVPDSAAECLRALGNMAALSGQRAPIYNACGRQALRMLNSPMPMLQRQAARLLNNIT